MKSTFVTLALCLTTLAVAPASASAAPGAGAAGPAAKGLDGASILAALDKRVAAFDDQSYQASMEIIRGGQTRKTLVFKAVMKGLDKQFIEFLEPGDVAGMKVLMQDASTLYVYMPEFNKVRRVAAHAMNQGFLGSDFTYEDMTQVQLSPFFQATLGGQQGNETTLVLTPKEGVEVSVAKVEVVIDKTKGGVTKLTYYDGAGNAVRQQTRTDWIDLKGTLVPTKITMLDLKSGDLTVITRKDIAVNEGVDDAIFSRRQLLRG
jgi:outer membrane lipoprotein-sorting protein